MRKIVEGIKDGSGAYVKEDTRVLPNVSIDDLLKESLINLQRIVNKISIETTKAGFPAKEIIQAQKDCVSMLQDLKKTEKELMEALDVKELEKELLK
jgi:hypothetical protein